MNYKCASDPWFIVSKCPDDAKLIANARRRNDGMPQHVLQRVRKIIADVKNPKIAVLGVSYKGNVDDTRESPSVEIIEQLLIKGTSREAGATLDITIYDPHVKRFDHELSAFQDTF